MSNTWSVLGGLEDGQITWCNLYNMERGNVV